MAVLVALAVELRVERVLERATLGNLIEVTVHKRNGESTYGILVREKCN